VSQRDETGKAAHQIRGEEVSGSIDRQPANPFQRAIDRWVEKGPFKQPSRWEPEWDGLPALRNGWSGTIRPMCSCAP